MKKKGFTLIELMIALAIFTIFSLYLYQTFHSEVKQSFNFNDNMEVQRNVNKALNMITDELRSYPNIVVSSVAASSEVQVISKGTNGGSDKTVMDVNISTSSADINYNDVTDVLSDNNGNQISNINLVQITQGTASGENELVIVTVSGKKGDAQYSSSTAINVRK